MLVLGLSGGRRMGNSEILVREALMGAQEIGASVELIRLQELTIKPPFGDMIGPAKGDHAHFLSEKLKEADGIILSCPVYVLTAPGFVLNMRDRVSGRMRPPEKFKIGAMIAVGATDWVNLALPLMYLFMPHGEVKIVDQMVVPYTHGLAQVVLNEQALSKARKLGLNVANAIDIPDKEIKYVSEEYWTCPICRQNLLKIRDQLVECPICDIKGTLRITKEGIKVTFTEEALKAYRFGEDGHKRHIQGMQKGTEICKRRQDEINEKVKKYETHIPATPPPSLDI